MLPKVVHKCTRHLPEFTRNSGYNPPLDYFYYSTIYKRVHKNANSHFAPCRQPGTGQWLNGMKIFI